MNKKDKVIKADFFMKLQNQCFGFVINHYRKNQERNDVEIQDIVSEMLKIVWQSYVNNNGLSQLVLEEKLLPEWQLRKLFLHALRNLKICKDNCHDFFSQAQVIKDEETGEIVDFYIPPDDDFDSEAEIPLTKHEKNKWLKKIKQMKRVGYSDSEIIEILKPIAMARKKKGKLLKEVNYVGELFKTRFFDYSFKA